MGTNIPVSLDWSPSASSRGEAAGSFSPLPLGFQPGAPPIRGSVLFDTTVGRCGIAWGANGVLAVHLPESSDAATRQRLGRGLPALPPLQAGQPLPQFVEDSIGSIVALLRGEPRDLREIVLDMQRIPPFHQRVYEVARAIDPGRTMTYGQIAQSLELPGASRAVGQALGSNPFVLVVPCHRVLAVQGQGGGFSAPGGLRTKLRLLAIERAFSQAPDPGGSFPLF